MTLNKSDQILGQIRCIVNTCLVLCNDSRSQAFQTHVLTDEKRRREDMMIVLLKFESIFVDQRLASIVQVVKVCALVEEQLDKAVTLLSIVEKLGLEHGRVEKCVALRVGLEWPIRVGSTVEQKLDKIVVDRDRRCVQVALVGSVEHVEIAEQLDSSGQCQGVQAVVTDNGSETDELLGQLSELLLC